MKVGDRVQYEGWVGTSEGIVTGPHEAVTGNWWVRFDSGAYKGQKLHAAEDKFKPVQPAQTPLDVARKALSDLEAAGLEFTQLSAWVRDQEEAQTEAVLKQRRDELSKRFSEKNENYNYSIRTKALKQAIDQIIELEDKLAEKEK